MVVGSIPTGRTMNYLYHAVPKGLQGDILYPLNALKEKYPTAYEKQIAKYVGREHITQQKIPFLNCLWNDVLHFSAVTPQEIRNALTDSGFVPTFPMSFFQVDPHLLDEKNTVVFLHKDLGSGNAMSESNFINYNPDDLADFSHLSSETKSYYVEKIKEGKNPLLYHLVPHILSKTSLEISNLPVVTV